MAATAYACLVSLLNTLDQIQTHPLVSTFFDINQNNYLSEKINFLVDFVEKYSESTEVEDLVRRIADTAHEAENIIELYVADRVRGGESPSFLHDQQMIMEKMDSIEEEVIIKVKEETGKSTSVLPDLPPPSSAPRATAEATTMVGFDHYVEELFGDLTGHDGGRKIISITGMGGIGKTTLVRNLYENLHVVRHFNVRVWVNVSQDTSEREVYLQALSCLGGGCDDTKDDQQLSFALYQSLFNQRYLIVLDDVWSVEIWDKINHFFPENKNGSRVVVTTRELKLIDHIGSSAIFLNFLDEEDSWKLFCEKTFRQQDFPSGLEEVGKKIVKNCGGLPLAINVIGGLLGKLPRAQWEQVAEDRSLFLNSAENKLLDILYLSYKYLPASLKPCFLYLGLYREDSNIDLSEVIESWVSEGFIKVKRDQSLEEVAKSYFYDLVDRNLLLVRNRRWEKYSIHDLLRDLCIETGKKENFFYVQRYHTQYSCASKMPLILQPLIVPMGRAAPTKTRLLRVSLWNEWHPRKHPRHPYYDPFQEVNVRLLRYRFSEKVDDHLLPSLVSRMWSLQTLNISTTTGRVVAPVEIWKMPQLRHINISYLSLPNPHPSSDDDVCVLQNLQTLKTVGNLIFTEEVRKRIPNIKELRIAYRFSSESGACPCYHLENLGSFSKLEWLHCCCYGPKYCPSDPFQNIKFPSSLESLTLDGCKLEWSYMAVIASLPLLESLSIYNDAVAATEWVFTDEKFVRLKHLNIVSCCHVTKWIAERSNFPVLENLTIWSFKQLDEIPSSIGEIPTLQSIYLYSCCESANISAIEILHEYERFGNSGLKVFINLGLRSNERALFREKIQDLGLTCQNLEIFP